MKAFRALDPYILEDGTVIVKAVNGKYYKRTVKDGQLHMILLTAAEEADLDFIN